LDPLPVLLAGALAAGALVAGALADELESLDGLLLLASLDEDEAPVSAEDDAFEESPAPLASFLVDA
jgi:hypothetical protein